jgi:hypothetical protein
VAGRPPEIKSARWANIVLVASNARSAADTIMRSVKPKEYARRYLAEAAYRFLASVFDC